MSDQLLMNNYEDMLTVIKQHLLENPSIKLAIYDRDDVGLFGYKASDGTIWETPWCEEEMVGAHIWQRIFST